MFTAVTLFRAYFLCLVGLVWHSVQAVPTPIVERDDVTVLSESDISFFSPYTLFASTSYCSPSLTLSWTCGPACNQLPGFKPIASGGDGATVQYWFVGYYPSMSSVVVVYQGSDPFKLIPLLTDADFFLESLDTSLFPGLASGAQVHNGFQNAYSLSQEDVLAAVNQGIATYGTKKVTIIGHSLGAAISTIAAVSMKLRLGSDYNFKVVGYGMPRVGNQAWVDWVDSNILDLTRIDNKHDPVPILPGRFLGFVGSHGEIHINDDNSWTNCPGDDNTAAQCTVTSVGNILMADPLDHLGPYDGILMGLCGLS